MEIIAIKFRVHFRAFYETAAMEIIEVDAPGQCPADTSVFDYENVPDDLYPITRK